MTFLLNNKFKGKDLPNLGLDNLGLPKMGKIFFYEAELIFFASVSAIFGVCLPHLESRISLAAFW